MLEDERPRMELIYVSIKTHSTNKTSFHPHLLAPSLPDRRTANYRGERWCNKNNNAWSCGGQVCFPLRLFLLLLFCFIYILLFFYIGPSLIRGIFAELTVDTREWPSTLGSTYPVDESKLLKHQIADSCHDRRGGGGLSGLSTLHDSWIGRFIPFTIPCAKTLG